jgi:Subtilase family
MTSERQDFRLMVGPEPFDPADAVPAAAAAGPQATVVQFAALLSPPDIDRLKAAYGLRIDRSIPNLSYLERLDTATADRVRADFLVRAVIPFPPASKLSPSLPATGPADLTGVLFDDSDAAAVTTALTALGAADVVTLDDRGLGGRLHLRFNLADATRLPQVAAIADITWIEPAPAIQRRDVEAFETIQSGSAAGAGSGTIWNQGLHGEGQVIGIIDEGVIDLNHCFFAGVPPNTPGPRHRKVLASLSLAGTEPDEHFMSVAGIAAGDELGNPGKHLQRGGAWAAKIVCQDYRDLMPRPPITTLETLQHMLDTARRTGATIHNLSWGNGDVYNTMNRDLDEFSVINEDQLVVAASNNTFFGFQNDGPAISYNALSVAATNAWPDQNDVGSGRPGPTGDGRRKPDLMAVGFGMFSATPAPTSPSPDVYCATAPAEGGTSFASPNAAAAAAIVRQYFTEGWYPTGEKVPANHVIPTGALIKAVLLNSTVNMVGPVGYPSNEEGWGIIQLDRTLFFAKGGGKRHLIAKDVPLIAGPRRPELRKHEFSVKDPSEQLKITFVWTNLPPAEQSRPVTNAFRFDVEDPNGDLYLGNDIDVTKGVSNRRTSRPRTPPDTVNNVQMVIVNDPVPGTWTVRLRPFGHQEKHAYALVISGDVR